SPEVVDKIVHRREHQIVNIQVHAAGEWRRVASNHESEVRSHLANKARIQPNPIVEQHIRAVFFDLCSQHVVEPEVVSTREPRHEVTSQTKLPAWTLVHFEAMLASPRLLHEPVVEVNVPRFMTELSQIPRIKVGETEQALGSSSGLLLVGLVTQPGLVRV